jgi:restriction endonuclease Mrr
MRVGLDMIRSAFECKLWAKNRVGETRDFRACVHRSQFHQGIYFTTRSFSKPGIEFAQDSAAVPIILVPGEEIGEIMMQKGIGLR